MELGDHTERVPSFDPFFRACTTDALSDAASFSSAWRALIAGVRSGGGPLMPVTGDPFSQGEFQQAIGRGNAKAETLDAKSHWGDLAYVQLKPEQGGLSPVAVFLVTYRSAASPDPNGAFLSATRIDFQADGQGRLSAVHIWSGVRLPRAPAMAWSNGPVTTINEPGQLEGLWQLRFHQLVSSWAAP